jgi:hypothetical protein
MPDFGNDVVKAVAIIEGYANMGAETGVISEGDRNCG